MRKKFTVPLIVLSILLTAVDTSACGDKLLHLSRIHRPHASNGRDVVLIFARPGSLLSDAASLNLEKAFREEAYHVILAKTESELALALQANVPDVLIADVQDLASVAHLTASPSLITIPVIAKADRKNAAEARRYPAVIKVPAKAGKFLDAVDIAFESKPVRQQAKLQPVSQPVR